MRGAASQPASQHDEERASLSQGCIYNCNKKKKIYLTYRYSKVRNSPQTKSTGLFLLHAGHSSILSILSMPSFLPLSVQEEEELFSITGIHSTNTNTNTLLGEVACLVNPSESFSLPLVIALLSVCLFVCY